MDGVAVEDFLTEIEIGRAELFSLAEEEIAAWLQVKMQALGERVAEGDQVDRVIGVEVRDEHRVHVGWITQPPQLPEHAAAALEQQREAAKREAE